MNKDPEKLYMWVGLRVHELRSQRGLTQGDMAKALGVSRPTISNLEKGRHRITLDLLFSVAQVLEVELADLLPTYAQLKDGGAHQRVESEHPLKKTHALLDELRRIS